MLPSSTHDTIIIGGSIAGSSLATHLARSGRRVFIIERKVFPRAKVCGEGLSAIGCKVLQDLVSPEIFTTMKLRSFESFRIVTPKREFELASDESLGGSILREELDYQLLKIASSSKNVQLVTDPNYQLKKVSNKWGSKWQIEGLAKSVSAPLLAIADGSNSPTSKRVGIAAPRGSPRYGIRVYAECLNRSLPHQVIILIREGFEIYCTPITDSVLNIAILGSRALFEQELRDPSSLKSSLKDQLRKIGFEIDIMTDFTGAGPVGHGKRVSSDPSILLIGDAAESLDPIGGMGMTHALLSSQLASTLISAYLDGAVSLSDLAFSYDARRESIAKRLRIFTSLVKYTLPITPKLGSLAPVLLKVGFPILHQRLSHIAS